MRSFLFIAALLCAAPLAAQTTVTLKVGQEVDTNPLRLDGRGSDPEAAARLVTSVEKAGPVGESGSLAIEARALGRVFYGLPSEDSLGLTTSAVLRGRVRPRSVLALAVSGRGRMEPARECELDGSTACSLNQDYRALRADGRSSVDFGSLNWGASAGVRHFAFGPDERLDWFGPGVGTSLDAAPTEALRLAVFYDGSVRHFSGGRTQIGTNGGIYVDEDVERRDTGHMAGTSAQWSAGRWALSLRYSFLRNRSNSTAKSYSRHTLEPSLTAIPAGDLLVRLSARIMRARYDTRGPQDASLNVDEEERNRVSVVLEHPLFAETLFVEGGWAFYGQAFQGRASDDAGEDMIDGKFRRHLVHLGLTVRFRGDR